MPPVDPAAATESLRARHPALDLAPGTLLAGRFRIEALLGIGGMGVVYRAHDLTLGIDVALKLLRPEWAARPQSFERFRQELLLARQVSSPQVVRIHDIAQHDDLCFISMDLVEGEALDKRLDREGALPLADILAIAKDIAQGLAAAHAVGVVHRDLKPANVLIDGQGRARIADFGVARSLGSGASSAGGIVGTPEYLSPEQARGETADARSDLYALGLILYEMLSGQLPFAGLTAAESLSQRMWRAPAPVRQFRADAPLWLQRLLDRLLRPKPGHRLATASAVLAALDSERVARDWRALARQAAVAAGLLAVSGGLWLAWSWRPLPAAPVPDRWVVLPIAAETDDAALRLALPAVEEWLRQALQAMPGTEVVSAERTRLALAQAGLDSTATVSDQALLDVLPARHLLSLRLQVADDGVRLRGELRQPGQAARPIDNGVPAETLAAASGGFWPQLHRLLAPGAVAAPPTPPSDAALRHCGEGLLLRGQGEFEAALAAFERCSQQAPEAAIGWRLWLESAELAGIGTDAVQPGQAWPDDAARQAIWRSWLAGEDAAALGALQAHLGAHPDDLDGLLQLARWQSAAGHFEAAELSLQALLQRDENDARAWFLRGKTAILHGEPRRAVEDFLLRALVLFKRSRDRFGEAEATNALGVGYARLGQSADAEEHYRKAVALRRALGHRRGVATSLRNLGQMEMVRGRLDAARSSFDEARALFEALQDRSGVAAIDNELGMLAEERGDYRAALLEYRAALRGREALDDQQGVAESLNNIGYAHYQLGAYDSARVFWQQALESFERIDDGNGRLRARQNLGLLAIARGDWKDAERLLLDTLGEAEAQSLLEEAAVSLRNLAELDLLRGRLESAAVRLQRARALFAERDDRRGLFDADLLQLRLLLASDDSHVPQQIASMAEAAADASFEQQALYALLRAEWAEARGDAPALTAALAEAATATGRAGIAQLGLRLRLQTALESEGALADALDADIQQLGNLPLRLAWTRRRLQLASAPPMLAAHYRDALPLLRRHAEALDATRSHRLALAGLDATAEPALHATASAATVAREATAAKARSPEASHVE